jgi:hypothetical protein
VLGRRESRHVVINMFDYTCHYCRDLHGFLLRAAAARPDDLAVLAMPVPTEVACNPFIPKTPPENVGACEYARYALAVFRARPEAFAEFDKWLWEPPRPPALEAIRLKAESLVGRTALQAALADPWLQKRMAEALAIYDAVGQGRIPKLLLAKAVTSGPIASYEQLERILKKEW